jgi:hypothetical protein
MPRCQPRRFRAMPLLPLFSAIAAAAPPAAVAAAVFFRRRRLPLLLAAMLTLPASHYCLCRQQAMSAGKYIC